MQWRTLVKNQPLAIIYRDTLISNTISLDWSVRLREPEEVSPDKRLRYKEEIDYYTELFNEMEGGFDNYISLILQDMLDLPFGGMSEIGRLDDDPKKRVVWVQHVDAASLIPTGNPEWPVMQAVPGLPSKPVVFPRRAVNRCYMNPRPEIKRKGWGMAPPEKVYLAIEMLYRGDRYYANLLLDTPEAGILDLLDMEEEDAKDWIESARELFGGIGGWKVPVLYEHEKAAQWIPFTRPPSDMLYDETTMKYAQVLAAGYGLRLSDIGMAELKGEKTLAGVIRGERQSRRTGYGTVRKKLRNHLNRILPPHLMLVWEEKDEEAKTEQARALSTYGLALGQLKRDGLLSPEEARSELVSTGLLEVEIDPQEVPEPEMPMGMPGHGMFEKPGEKTDKRKPFGKTTDEDRGRVKDEEKGKVSPTKGGRGGLGSFLKRQFGKREAETIKPKIAPDQVIERMKQVVQPGIAAIPEKAEPPRLRRLIKVITRAMVPMLQKTFGVIDDDAIERVWLPEMQALEFDLPSELDSLVIRQTTQELRDMLDEHLDDDPWWKTATAWEKSEILAIFRASYEAGLEDMALNMVRSLYEEGLASVPTLAPTIDFDLVDHKVIRALEHKAAEMVTHVDEGTKYFLKRIVVAGVRRGLSRQKMAAAIRDGQSAERILRDEGFMDDVIDQIMNGLIEMTEKRAMSIVNTEVKGALVAGQLEQIKRTGLTKKGWRHFGERGVTAAGNVHPCPVCVRNEELGFVPFEYLYETVFKRGGPQGDGKAPGPPAHPNVCHCSIVFDEAELFATVKKGEFAPWLGG